MARPIKARKVCEKPKVNIFGPIGNYKKEYIFMTLEEYETIRLIDHNNLTQEECAEFMEVARTTVQKIYEDARRKIADVLVNGKTLKIEGGNYRLCENIDHGRHCKRGGRGYAMNRGRRQNRNS